LLNNRDTGQHFAAPAEYPAVYFAMGRKEEAADDTIMRLNHAGVHHRQRALADAVGDAARAELAKSKARQSAKSSGTRMARNRRPAAEGGE
jgi:hypothetical protein